VRHLPERVRQVIKMRYREGKTISEVAEILGIDKEWVYKDEKSAITFLRRRMNIQNIH